jgi:hypothetical protein
LGLRTEWRTRAAGTDRNHSAGLAGVLTQDAFSQSKDSNRPPRGRIRVSHSGRLAIGR